MKPLYLDGVTYTPTIIFEMREQLIPIRDAALKVSHFNSAVLLSHTLALLDYLARNTDNA